MHIVFWEWTVCTQSIHTSLCLSALVQAWNEHIFGNFPRLYMDLTSTKSLQWRLPHPSMFPFIDRCPWQHHNNTLPTLPQSQLQAHQIIFHESVSEWRNKEVVECVFKRNGVLEWKKKTKIVNQRERELCVCLCVCMYVCMCVCMYVCMCVCVCIYIYIYMYVCMYVYVCKCM